MKLSPLQKIQKKQLDNLDIIHKSILSAWSFGKISSWRDLATIYLSLPQALADKFISEHPSEITYPSLKSYLAQQKQELLDKHKQNENIQTISEDANISPPPGAQGFSGVNRNNNQYTIKLEERPNLQSSDNAVSQKSEQFQQPVGSVERDVNSHLNDKNNYGWEPSPNQSPKYFAYWFQKKAQTEVYTKLIVEDKPAALILSGTGTGKTFMVGAVCRRLQDEKYHEGKTLSHVNYLYVTRITVVEQAGRVMKNTFNLIPEVDIEIINIEQLRSKAGKFWIKEIVTIHKGEEVTEYRWKPIINPVVIFFDESQAAKNSGSTQTEIMCAYSKLPNGKIVHISATPFTKVAEARCFAISTKRPLDHLGYPPGTILTEATWSSYAQMMCGHTCTPDEHNEAAIGRLMQDLDDYVVRVKGVRPQFEAHNHVEKIPFQSPEAALAYQEAWERFVKEKAKWEEGVGDHPFAVMMRFSIAAETIRAPVLAKKMYEAVQTGKYAAVCACKWKPTIIQAVKILIEKYGIKRDNISLIWGGGQTQLNSKQKTKRKIIALRDKFEKVGLNVQEMLESIDLDKVEDRVILDLPPEMRLGAQNLDDRQIEIDRFQSGKSEYCFFTFRAGGVGLSLHHSDEFTNFKCRRKESGYAVEEDIPKVTIKPRKVYVAPTYSAIELVQGLGRCPRLTSLSVTDQTLLFYQGTIEDDIADIVSQKLRCLTKVVKFKESWADVIIGSRSKEAVLDSTKSIEDDTGEIELNDEESDDE